MTDPTSRETETSGLPHLSDAEVAGYLDHALPLDARQRVELHIDQCTTCRHEIVALSRVTSDAPVDEPARHDLPRRGRRWWIPAAAAAAIVAITLPRLTSYLSAPDSAERTRRLTDADARPQITVVSPDDRATRATPLVFTWRAAKADVYRIVVLTTEADSVWAAETSDTTITLPDSVSLQAGRAYFWYVEGIGNGIAATTGSRRLEILT